MNIDSYKCQLLIPDGSLKYVVDEFLSQAGLSIYFPTERSYSGTIGNEGIFPKNANSVIRMRPWDMPLQVALGNAALAITAQDMIWEAGIEMLKNENPVQAWMSDINSGRVIMVDSYPISRAGVGFTQLSLAVPNDSVIESIDDLNSNHRIATEYVGLAKRYFFSQGITPDIMYWHGSLEAAGVFADAILENVETGRSLEVNGWKIIASLPRSRACLIADPRLMDTESWQLVLQFSLVLRSVIEAKKRVLISFNVDNSLLDDALRILPAADKPTVSSLAGIDKSAVQSVLFKNYAPLIMAKLKRIGCTALFGNEISWYIQ